MTADTAQTETLHETRLKRALRSGTSRRRSRPASASPSRSARSRRPAARSAAAASRCWTAMRVVASGSSRRRAMARHRRAATGPRSSCARRRRPGLSRLRCASTRQSSTSRTRTPRRRSTSSVVARPDHTLTVKVASGGVPIEEAIIRLGPYRATTDASGQAAIKLAKGRYELVVWKAGYDTDPRAAHDRRGCLRRGRGAGAAGGRS